MLNQQTLKQKNQIVVITGANSGIGYAVAESLYQKGQTVIFGARNVEKNQSASQQIKKRNNTGDKLYPNRSIVGFHLDLSNKKSIQQFAQQIRKYLQEKFKGSNHIDILINNAGILGGNQLDLIEGIEKSLYVNHFGHFYLTYLLFPLLTQAESAKIINLTSDMSTKIVEQGKDQNLKEGEYAESSIWDLSCKNKKYDSFEQYAISKLFNHMFSVELQNQINKRNKTQSEGKNKQHILSVKVAAIHPGFVDTNFGSHSQLVQNIKEKYANLIMNREDGAKGIIALCQRDVADWNDDYYGEDGNKKKSNQISHNPEKTSRLWALSEQVLGIKFDPSSLAVAN